MRLSAEDKVELSRYRMEKAKRLLADAERLLGSASHESSVNRSYYAVLTSARALLALRGADDETRDRVRTLLSKEFIRTGDLPRELGETFRSIQARRLDSDYGDYVEIGVDEASDSLKRAQAFVATAEEVMNRLVSVTPRGGSSH